MRPVTEQVEVILTKIDSVYEWAVAQLPEGITMQDRHFGHFISAGPEDFERLLPVFGFDASQVSIGAPRDDQYCAEFIEGMVQVYSMDRGTKNRVEYFKTRTEVEKRLMRVFTDNAFVNLSQDYRDKYYPTQSMLQVPELYNSYAKFELAWPNGSPTPLAPKKDDGNEGQKMDWIRHWFR